MGPGLEEPLVSHSAALTFCRRYSYRLGIRSRAYGARATEDQCALLSCSHPLCIVFVSVYYLCESHDFTEEENRADEEGDKEDKKREEEEVQGEDEEKKRGVEEDDDPLVRANGGVWSKSWWATPQIHLARIELAAFSGLG